MSVHRGPLSNTEYERIALSGHLNLSDGHARHTLSPQQRSILERAPELLDTALSRETAEVEAEFLHSFFACAAQDPLSHHLQSFLTYSASCAIKLTAQYCRIRGLTVHLLEPCFDNIRHLLEREDVVVSSVREEELRNPSCLADRLNPKSVLWIVQPNNPTGFCLEQRSFQELITQIAQRGATLVVDFCFRFFARAVELWDQYEALSESGASFICIEDTGKTWALGGIKVGITVCSSDIAPIIYRLHDELLLNVSPFELVLLTQFVRNTINIGLDVDIRAAVEVNRMAVHSLVDSGLVSHATTSCRNVPMELLRLPPRVVATEFWHELRQTGVEVLPAHNYYWSLRGEGAGLFRIPLSRPKVEVQTAIPMIARVVRELEAR